MTEAVLSTTSGPTGVRYDRGVGLWLLAIALLIGIMVVIGGLTRLTGSGLSITEWRPVTGALPPLSDTAWQAEFAKYQGTAQYEFVNSGMTLSGFKAIYWWEWSHRFLGRFIGVVFAIPFLIFWRQKRIDGGMAKRLAVIFVLGGAQGALGWWMVRSGLEPRTVAVSQYRLAAHLGLAFVLFGYVLWSALEILHARRTKIAALARFAGWGWALSALLFVQMLLGAFMAGTKAGLAFNTWPDYAGRAIPLGMYDLEPWWINHFENPNLVHFQHRTVAYVVAALIAWLFYALSPSDKPVRSAMRHVVALTLLQFLLGIATVIAGVPLWIAALHQVCALLLFGSALWLTYAVRPARA